MRAVSVTDDLLNSAFQLAYFILGDRAASTYVAMTAMDKLKAASALQGRRLYYTPVGRQAHPATRNKVNLSDLHLLQRLIYIESDLFERLLEGQVQSVRPEDLIIRYIKHLIRITTKHNSFYVTLGLCRLLYNYTTSETAEIYNLVLQDPLRMRDDHYYRSRKKRLMEEMKSRFGDLIRTERGFRGTERFQTDDTSQIYAGLVKECLIRFTPWQSTCVLPRELDPKKNVVTPLLFEGRNPDDEHEIELNRIHSLTHPGCFERLTAALGIDAPDRRLAVPRFFVSGGGPRAAVNRFNPSELTDGELDAIKHQLEKNSIHRKTYSAGRLVCLVDQVRTAVFEPGAEKSINFDVKPDAELLEVRAVLSEEEIPVAIYPIDHGPSGITRGNSLAVLEGGQRFSFTIEPQTFASATVGASVSVSYDHPAKKVEAVGLVSTFAPLADRFSSLAQRWRSVLRERPRRLTPVFALFLLAIFGAGLWSYLHLKKAPPAVSSVRKTDEAKVKPEPPVLAPAPSESSVAPPRAERHPAKPAATEMGKPPLSAPATTEDSEATRGSRLRPPSIALRSARRVFIDPLGDDDFSRRLRANLIAKLRVSGHFTLVTNREEADAVFKRSVNRTMNRRTSVALELVDASGQKIWSFPSNRPGRTFLNAEEASEKILATLLHDLTLRPRKSNISHGRSSGARKER